VLTTEKLRKYLHKYPVIAAADVEHLSRAVSSGAGLVILMHLKVTDLLNQSLVPSVRRKIFFIHLDLVSGLSSEKEAIALLKKALPVHGIVTTKGNMIRAAKREGLLTIQRVFLIDSESMVTAVRGIKKNTPDAVEIMPGIVPSAVKQFRQKIDQPIISSGLIHTKEQIEEALKAGSDAVSLSQSLLWDYQRSNRDRTIG
jgi:glycerol uptake operon antiterminator